MAIGKPISALGSASAAWLLAARAQQGEQMRPIGAQLDHYDRKIKNYDR
jgi:hypothetical protein